MELTKEGLYGEIKKYIYDDLFADLNVFSKQYFHCIVSPSYSENSNSDPYSVISIDFNNMQQINKNGMKKGDKILHDSIEIMQSVLPENSSTLRLGGDEFLFILNNTSKEAALECEAKMHEQLERFSKKIKGTTVTSYCLSSEEGNNIDSLIDIADVAITSIKQNAKISNSLDKWDILEEKAKENFSTFFKTLRFHNYPMEVSQLQKVLLDVITTYDNFSKQEDPSKQTTQNNIEDNENNNTIYSKDDLKELNALLTDNNLDSNNLENFDESTLANILNSLVRDSITQQFSEPYLKKFLLQENSDKFKALKISPAFVKFSNTINSSHSTTNVQMENYHKDFYDFLNNRINFNQDTFTNAPLNYMVALSGGDMLLALDPKTDIKVEDIKEFLNEKNTAKYSADNLLRYVVGDSFDTLDKKSFKKVLSKQTEECNNNKIPLIGEILNDDIVKDLLDVSLKDTLQLYSELVPDMSDVSAKTKYVEMVSRTILDVYSTLDVVHDEDVKKVKENPFSKIVNRVSSLFKKKPLALPTPEQTYYKHGVPYTNPKSRTEFVPKVQIDYSKVNYNLNKDNQLNKDLNKNKYNGFEKE